MNQELVRYAMQKAYEQVRYFPPADHVDRDDEQLWNFLGPSDLAHIYSMGLIDLPTLEDSLDRVLGIGARY